MPLWFLTNAIRNWNTFGIELRNRNFLDVFSFRLCTSSLQPALILLCLGRRYRSPSCGDLQYDAAAVPAGVTVQITHIFWQSWYLIMSLDFTWCSESLFSCTTIFFILLLFRVFWNNRQSVSAIQSQHSPARTTEKERGRLSGQISPVEVLRLWECLCLSVRYCWMGACADARVLLWKKEKKDTTKETFKEKRVPW